MMIISFEIEKYAQYILFIASTRKPESRPPSQCNDQVAAEMVKDN